MRYSNRFIVLSLFIISSNAHALGAFVDALYWQANEPIDWALTNSRSTPYQNITYKTIDFDFKPGFRIGIGSEGSWDTKLYYTQYHTNEKDAIRGNVVPTFLGGILARPSSDFFYQAEQVNFNIDFNMLDWDFSKRFYPTQYLMLRPLVGLEGGTIDQNINTYLQGQNIAVTEKLKNDFSGVGPKTGIESKLTFLRSNNYQLNLVANFTTSYLWGNWDIKDRLKGNILKTYNVKVANRNFGAFALQALIGAGFDYKRFSINLGYEIGDWFNQFQGFDDGTGPHHTDLILQGATLNLSYNL
jgi:hypothetical protein